MAHGESTEAGDETTTEAGDETTTEAGDETTAVVGGATTAAADPPTTNGRDGRHRSASRPRPHQSPEGRLVVVRLLKLPFRLAGFVVNVLVTAAVLEAFGLYAYLRWREGASLDALLAHGVTVGEALGFALAHPDVLAVAAVLPVVALVVTLFGGSGGSSGGVGGGGGGFDDADGGDGGGNGGGE